MDIVRLFENTDKRPKLTQEIQLHFSRELFKCSGTQFPQLPKGKADLPDGFLWKLNEFMHIKSVESNTGHMKSKL